MCFPVAVVWHAACLQLLHAHFTRMPIEHLQAYMHQAPTRSSTPMGGGQAAAAASATPAAAATPLFSPQLSRLESDPVRSRLMVTRMDDRGATPAEAGAAAAAAFSDSVASAASSSLSLHERAELAAHGGAASRRHSFLVQIDDSGINPMLLRNDSTTSLVGSAGGDLPSAVTSPPQPPARHLRSRSLASSSLTSSLLALTDPFVQRTPSLRELKRDRAQLKRSNCCVRVMMRLTSLPLSTAVACSTVMLALPKQMVQHALHPSLFLSLPTRLFGAFKRVVGGAVMQRPEPTDPDAALSLDASADLPVARITTA